MPTVDTPFVIGVIRERTKELLGADHYQRIIDADNISSAVQVLADTIYAPYLGNDYSIGASLNALTLHLKEVQDMLTDTVDHPSVVPFIAARYDGLNITAALLEKKLDYPEPTDFNPLGIFPPTLLQGVIWNNVGLEELPAYWRPFLVDQLNAPLVNHWPTQLVAAVAEHTLGWMEQLAFTPFMQSLVRFLRLRQDIDTSLRFTDAPPPADLIKTITQAGYTIPQASLEGIRANQNATAYEQAWDSELIRLLAPARHHPIGYDPIIVFWFEKELEVKTLRLLLLAKANQIEPSALAALIRPLPHLAV